MALIPKLNTTLSVIDALEFGGEPRTYLGMSSIGEECSRKLWYGFHWVENSKHGAKKERTFNAGHMFESQIIKQLKLAGMRVFRIDENGNEIELFGNPDDEQEEFIGFAGHAKGHCDGRILGVIESPKTVHGLELKTMAEKYFKLCKKLGLIKYSPGYYAQMTRYADKMKLDRFLFIAINKNTSELHIERIEIDKSFAKDLEIKERTIIMAHEPPAKAYSKGFYKCNYCSKKEICHEGEQPIKNCRTCEYSDIEDNGVWSCSKKDGKHLPDGLQRKGCSHYKKGWGL